MFPSQSPCEVGAEVVSLEVRLVVESPWLRALLCDDVHHTAAGIAAIERTGCSPHYLDVLHARHVQTGEVDVVQRLARQAFAIHEEEDALPAETAHVQVFLLVHGEGELHARQFLLEEPFDVGSIGLFDVSSGDEACLDGSVLQQFGSARASHHHVVQVEGGVLLGMDKK